MKPAWSETLLALLLGLTFASSPVRAATYQILQGALSEAETGTRTELTGSFEATLAPFDVGPGRLALVVDDFEFEAGARRFTPAPPVEFDGLDALLFLVALPQIGLEGSEVELIALRAGGELVASADDEVTFRFLDFRSWSISDPDAEVEAGISVGVLGDGVSPRRLHLEGTLYAIEETFRIRREPCPPPPSLEPVPIPSPGPGGGGVVITSQLTSQFTSFDIEADETAVFTPPQDGDAPRSRVTSGGLDVVTGEVVANPPVFLGLCPGLLPRFPPEERELGRFRLVATAARPVEVEVRPGRRDATLPPGARGRVPVAILGSEALDVREIDAQSLRLGPGEAAPARGVGRRDLDRDGIRDLLARFPVRDTGLAYGDDLLCLVGATREGETIEGCDAIRTLPHRLRAPRRGSSR